MHERCSVNFVVHGLKATFQKVLFLCFAVLPAFCFAFYRFNLHNIQNEAIFSPYAQIFYVFWTLIIQT